MNATSPQITFRNIPPSEAARARIVERTAQFAKFHPRIMSCRVVVRAPHRHGKDRLYSIRIEVPRREIVINRDSTPGQEHKDIYVAIRDAFDALDRRLEDTARRQRGDVKAHSTGKLQEKTADSI